MAAVKHLPGLDGLRGVAIIAVVLFHWNFPFARGGFVGVDLFFVISGFLISTLLLRELTANGEIDLRNFYARRALRLLPALVVMCGVYGLWLLLRSDGAAARHGARVLAAVLFYCANWMLALGPHDRDILAPMTHTWSLSVEEQFYVLWPITLAWLAGRKATLRATITLLVSVIALATAWRIYLTLTGTWYVRMYVGADTRIDTILVGCLLAVLMYHGKVRIPSPPVSGWLPWAALASFALLVFFARESARWMYLVGCSIAAAVGAGLVLGALTTGDSRFGRLLGWTPLQWLGRVSYGVYLWHLPLTEFFRRLGLVPVSARPDFRGLLLLIGSTLGAATASFYIIERPFLRLRKRVEPRKPGLAAPEDQPPSPGASAVP
jgi:peptidoglycan/LPS O-acetylase OafA/YrhL